MNSLTGTRGVQRADATYVLRTDDGANIAILEKAVIPFVEVLFQAGAGKYDYLNNITAFATGTENNGLLSLNFWQVSVGNESEGCNRLLIRSSFPEFDISGARVWTKYGERVTTIQGLIRLEALVKETTFARLIY